ncbi:MAG: hypothetical protein ACK50Q_17310 [Labrys sp. (in: a-proteobacteria)]|jgi:hypothetical protein
MTPSSNKTGRSRPSLIRLSLMGAAMMLVSGPAMAEWRPYVFFDVWHGPLIFERPAAYGPNGEPIYVDPQSDDVVVYSPDLPEDAYLDEPPPARVTRGEPFDPGFDVDQDGGPSVVEGLAPRIGKSSEAKTVKPRRIAEAAPVSLPVPRPNLEAIDASGDPVPARRSIGIVPPAERADR